MRIISRARYAVPVRLILNFCAWSAVSTDVLFLQGTPIGKQTKVKPVAGQAINFIKFLT